MTSSSSSSSSSSSFTRRLLFAALALSMGGAMSCTCGQDKDRREPLPKLKPLVLASGPTALQVDSFGDAVLSVPLGVTHAMPVLVAVLGIGDTPEEQCAAWHDVLGTRAFVLCPRGAPNMVQEESDAAPVREAPAESGNSEDESEAVAVAAPPTTGPKEPTAAAEHDSGQRHQVGFYPVDLTSLDKEVTAMLSALKTRYGNYVADNNIVYAGFSRGAFLGASLVAKHPNRFARAILIEGGQTAWQPATITSFAKGGGRRVLFACGQQSCVDDSEAASARLHEQKIETRVVHGQGEGHGYKKQVKEELRRSFDWVVDGDPLWQQALVVR